MFGELYDKEISNLIRPGNSGINYERMLLFVFFLFTGRSGEILWPQATPGLLHDYKEVTLLRSKKQNGRQRKQFLKIYFDK